MDGNRDDAERCLHLAEAALASNDKPKAQRLLEKSRRMFPLSEEQAVLQAKIRLHVPSGASSSSTFLPKDVRDKPVEEEEDKPREPTKAMLDSVNAVRKAKSHYEVLGVGKDANDAAVKKAYKKFALRLHPDRNCAKGADEAFKKVGAAFLTLSDVDKRAHYDRFGEDAPEGNAEEGVRRRGPSVRKASPFGDFVHVGGEVNADELFAFLFQQANERMFTEREFRAPRGREGGRRARQRQRREHEPEAGRETMGLFERIRPFLYLIMMIVVAQLLGAGESNPPVFSLERTKYHGLRRESENGVAYFTTRAMQGLGTRQHKNLERMVDSSALESWFAKCERETMQARALLRQSKRWLIGKKERERYRHMYEAFQKPWCARAMQLRDNMRRQGYTY